MGIRSEVILSTAKFRKALKVLTKDVEKSFEKQERDVKKSSRSMSDTFSKGMRSMKRAALAFGAIFATGVVASIVRGMVGIASASEETRSKFEAVFGEMSTDVDDFVRNFVQKTELTVAAGRNAAATFGGLFASAGASAEEASSLSKEALAFAGDLASFNNTPLEDAIGALRSGLTGEMEPLKRFNIILRDSAVNAGDSAAEISLLDKTTRRLREAMRLAGQQIGDLDRTSDSLANRLKRIQGNFARVREEVSTRFLPVFEDVVDLIDRLPGDNFGDKFGDAVTTNMVAPLRKFIAFTDSLVDQWDLVIESMGLRWVNFARGLTRKISEAILESKMGSTIFGIIAPGLLESAMAEANEGSARDDRLAEILAERIALIQGYQEKVEQIDRETEASVNGVRTFGGRFKDISQLTEAEKATKSLQGELDKLKAAYDRLADTNPNTDATETLEREIARYKAMITSIEKAIEREKERQRLYTAAWARLGPGEGASMEEAGAFAELLGPTKLAPLGIDTDPVRNALSEAEEIVREFADKKAILEVDLDGDALERALEDLEKGALASLEEIRKKLKTAIASGDLSTTEATKFNDLLDSISDATTDSDRIKENFAAVARSARALLQVGDVLGGLSDDARRIGESVINIADSLGSLRSPDASGLDKFTSALGIVAAGLSIVRSLVSSGTSAKDRAEEARKISVERTERLIEIREEIRSQTRTLAEAFRQYQKEALLGTELTGFERDGVIAIETALRDILANIGDPMVVENPDGSVIEVPENIAAGSRGSSIRNQLLALEGFAPDLFGGIAELFWNQVLEAQVGGNLNFSTLGNILQGVLNGAGGIPGITTIADDLANADGLINDSVSGAIRAFGLLSSVIGEDAAVAFADFFRRLQEAGGISDELSSALSDFGAALEEGDLDAAQEVIDALAGGILSGDSDILGGLVPDEFLDILSTLGTAIDRARSDGGTSSSSAQFSRAITEIQASNLLSLMQTSLYWEERTAVGVERLVALFSSTAGATPSGTHNYAGPRLPGSGVTIQNMTVQANNADEFLVSLGDAIAQSETALF